MPVGTSLNAVLEWMLKNRREVEQGPSVLDKPGEGVIRELLDVFVGPETVVGMPAATARGPAKMTAKLAETLPKKAAAAPIRAYHGSPHDFDKFSLSKIGTGEGAQAYGHGLYFAENEKVARGYRDQLGSGTVKLYGQEYPVPPWRGDMDPHTRLVRRLADERGAKPLSELSDNDVVAKVRGTLEKELTAQYGDKASIKRELELLDRAVTHPEGVKTDPGGRMYEVGLHASPDEFLDWDLPLSQQDKFLEKLNKAGVLEHMPWRQGQTVDEGVRALEAKHGKAKAAEMLKSAGIKGIRYLDQGSRDKWNWKVSYGPGEGYTKHATKEAADADLKQALAAGKKATMEEQATRNFVVFDDEIIDIMKKYGVALPVAAAMKAQMDQRQQQNPRGRLADVPTIADELKTYAR